MTACTAIETPLLPGPPPPSLPLVPASHRKGDVRVSSRSCAWPASCKNACWHCCHHFQGPPIPMPTSYDDRRDAFHVVGTFCSWPCMKAHNLESKACGRDIVAMVISMFHTRCTGDRRTIRPAPPRLALRAFGGGMSLEEFRACAQQVAVAPAKLLFEVPRAPEVPARLRERPTAAQLNMPVSFEDATAKNDMVRLRRPKATTTTTTTTAKQHVPITHTLSMLAAR